jgi:hypothetical protein
MLDAKNLKGERSKKIACREQQREISFGLIEA